MDTRTAFSLLGISPGASPDAIRDAYRDLAKVWHPDRFAGDARLQAKASERMRELNEAFRIASGLGMTTGAAIGSATPRAAGSASAPRAAATTAGDAPWSSPFLSFDTLWRSLFWAGACGAALFVVTAPEGFFALARGRAVAREARPRTAEAITFTRLPESETGEATLVARVRGTWVVAEHDRAAWLPAGTRLDVQGGRLSCAPPGECAASFQPVGASRLALRGATPEDAREIEVLFASPTSMLWLVRPAGNRAATPSRVLLQAQGVGASPWAASAAAP